MWYVSRGIIQEQDAPRAHQVNRQACTLPAEPTVDDYEVQAAGGDVRRGQDVFRPALVVRGQGHMAKINRVDALAMQALAESANRCESQALNTGRGRSTGVFRPYATWPRFARPCHP